MVTTMLVSFFAFLCLSCVLAAHVGRANIPRWLVFVLNLWALSAFLAVASGVCILLVGVPQ